MNRTQPSTPSTSTPSSTTPPTSKQQKQPPPPSSSSSSLPQQDNVSILQRRIAKRFPDTIDADGNDIYWGVVAQVDRMESGEFFYFIRYDDGDTEHVGWVELTRMMALYDDVGEPKKQKTVAKGPVTPAPVKTRKSSNSSSSSSRSMKKKSSSSSPVPTPPPKKKTTAEIISPKAKKLRKELEDRFFADLALVPSKDLSILAKFVPINNNSSSPSSGKSKKIRRFYRDLSGQRTPAKHALLNRALCSVLLFWKMPDRVQVQYYSQGTLLATYCPPLSRVFMSHGVNYNITSDFKGANQFVSIVKDIYGLTYKQWEQKFFRDLGKTEFAYMANPRKRFYDVVSGEKSEAKKVILNLCLRAVLPQWKTRGMLDTGLNSLQFSWNQENVQFDLWNDFGGEEGVMTMLEGVEEDLTFSGLCLESSESTTTADAVGTTAGSTAGRDVREDAKQQNDRKKDRKEATTGHENVKQKDKKKKDSRKEKEKKDKKNKKESKTSLSSSGSKKSSSSHEKRNEKFRSDDYDTSTPFKHVSKKRKSEYSPTIASTRSTRRNTTRSTSPPHSTSSSSSHSNKRKSPPPPSTPKTTTTTPTFKKPKTQLSPPPPPHISALPTTKHSLLLTLLSNRFFSSLSTHPSTPLSCLSALVTSANGTPIRRFYLVLRGSKNEAKERVFRDVVECVLNDWRCQWGGERYDEEEMNGLRWLLKERFESRGVGFDLCRGGGGGEVAVAVPRINVRCLVRDEMLRVMATKIKIDDKEHLLWMLLFLFAVDVFRGGDVKDYNVIMAGLRWSDVRVLTVDDVTKTKVLEVGYNVERQHDDDDEGKKEAEQQQQRKKQSCPRLSMMRQENSKDLFCLVRLTETYISMIEQQQQSSSSSCVNFFQNVIKPNNDNNSTKEYKYDDDPPISPTDITSHLKSLMRHCQLDVELLDFFLSDDRDDGNNSYRTKYYDRPHLIIPTTDYCLAAAAEGDCRGGMASPDGSIRFDVYATERIRSCPHFNIEKDKAHLLWFLCWSFKTKLYPKAWGMVAKLRTDQVKITTTTTELTTKKRLEISDENGIYSIQDEDPTDPYCIVKHCQRYKGLQSKQAIKFFTRPFESDKLWYSNEPIGKNGLKVFLRHLATMCGLPMDAYRRVQMANNGQNDDKEWNGRTRSSSGGGRRSIDSDRTTPSSSPTSTTGGLLTPGKFKTNDSNMSPEKLIIKADLSFNNDPIALLSTLIWQFKTKFISRSWRDFLMIDYHRVKILENPKRVQLDLKNHHMKHQDTKRGKHNAMRYVKNAQPKNPLCVVKLTELYLSMNHPSAVKFFNNPVDNKVEKKRLEDSGSPIRFNTQPLKRDRMRKFVMLLAKRCDFEYEDHKDVKKLDCVGGTSIVWEDEDERRENDAVDAALKGPSFISLLEGKGVDDEDENSDGGGNVRKEKETDGNENEGVGGHCHGGGVDNNVGGSFIIPTSKETTKKQNDVNNSITTTEISIDETRGNGGGGNDDTAMMVVPNKNETGNENTAAVADSAAPPVTTNEKKSTKGFKLLCV